MSSQLFSRQKDSCSCSCHSGVSNEIAQRRHRGSRNNCTSFPLLKTAEKIRLSFGCESCEQRVSEAEVHGRAQSGGPRDPVNRLAKASLSALQ